MRLMQIHKPRNGYKPVSPQPFDFSRYAGRQSKLLMRTDVKRREIWEWSDHTPVALPKPLPPLLGSEGWARAGAGVAVF
jgi:hypothetical protein